MIPECICPECGKPKKYQRRAKRFLRHRECQAKRLLKMNKKRVKIREFEKTINSRFKGPLLTAQTMVAWLAEVEPKEN